jgi:hypothetical protein
MPYARQDCLLAGRYAAILQRRALRDEASAARPGFPRSKGSVDGK